MTEQQVFDHVVTHLRRQGCKATDGQKPFYRYGSLKCAIGCLIPDDRYDALFEGRPADEPFVMATLSACGIDNTPSMKELLLALQRTHDVQAVSDWETRFAYMATYHSLTVPPIQ